MLKFQLEFGNLEHVALSLFSWCFVIVVPQVLLYVLLLSSLVWDGVWPAHTPLGLMSDDVVLFWHFLIPYFIVCRKNFFCLGLFGLFFLASLFLDMPLQE